MVRKKKTTVDGRVKKSSNESMGASMDVGAEEDLGPSVGFDRARASFGKTEELIRMNVLRVTQDGSEESLKTFEYDSESHNTEFLREHFGPGKYRLRFVGEDWLYRMVLTVRIGEIAGVPGGGPSPAVASSASPGFDPLPYFMREAEKSREQFNTMIVAMLGRSEGGGKGNEALVALIKAQSEQNTALLEKLVNRPSGSNEGVETVMKALELGMTAVADIKMDSDGGWVSALRSVAKELGPVLSQIAQKQGAGAPSPPPSDASPLGSPSLASPPSVPDPSGADTFRGLLLRYAPIALQVAKEGLPPVEFAGQLLDSIGVNFHPLFDSLQANDLVSLQPELGTVIWKSPVDGTESRWIDVVVQLLHKRDWGVQDDEEELPVSVPSDSGV